MFTLNLYSQNKELTPFRINEDSEVIEPEHLSGDLAKLLHDWQINFTSSLNGSCLKGDNVIYHDSVLTRRLFEYPTEMELSYNELVKRYIEMYTVRRRDLVAHMLTVGEYYFPMFEEELDRLGLPLELKYLPVIESALNPIAVSRAGATGLWQFMLRTGRGYGLEVNTLVDERRDPYKSTVAAVKYLKDLYAIYEDWNLVIAAYNCGPGNVNKAIARSGGKRDYWEIYHHLPRETRGYVPSFVAANYVMNYYEEHNICPVEAQTEFFALDTIHVESKLHFSQLSEVLDIPISELRRWNPQFRRDQVPGNFKSYALVLPTNMITTFMEKEKDIIDYKNNQFNTHRLNTDQYIAGTTGTASSGGGENVYYKVRSGDTLSKIASRNRVTVSQLRSWNNLRSTRINVGRSLIVGKRPVKAPEVKQEEIQNSQPILAGTRYMEKVVTTRSVNDYYRVRRGDNLGKIASRNGVSVAQLKSWNGLSSDRLSIGRNLIVNKRTETIEEYIEAKPIGKGHPDPVEKKEGIELNVPPIIKVDPSIIEIDSFPVKELLGNV